MFNIACYYAKKWDASHAAEDKNEALKALRESVEVWPANADDALSVQKGQDGEEFVKLSTDPEFKAIVESAKKPKI
jgi:hypothetical protein